MGRVLIFVLVLLLVGCKSTPAWPWKTGVPCDKAADGKADCSDMDVLNTYSQARSYCLDLSDLYEGTGSSISSSRFWIASFGTLSGAVFAPLAGGSAKDAWSGVSGSTNALQSALDENFSNAVFVRRRQEIADSGKVAREGMSNVSNVGKVLLAMDIAYDCRMAVARADAAAASAINQLQSKSPALPISDGKSAAQVNPVETKAQAQGAALAAAGPASAAAANAAVPSTATPAVQAIVQTAGAAAANAATQAAAPAAAKAAMEVAAQTLTPSADAPALANTQAAAQAAAQAAGEVAAREVAQKAAQATIPKGSSSATVQAVKNAANAAVSAATQAAAQAAAQTASRQIPIGQSQPINIEQ
ncbi:hypothetical protein PFWH6_3531 [Pseudomonas fluorescens WH6]|nr:hypothetical protein PFWH6_3531 [Pseudomonas fluorescens WH6]